MRKVIVFLSFFRINVKVRDDHEIPLVMTYDKTQYNE